MVFSVLRFGINSGQCDQAVRLRRGPIRELSWSLCCRTPRPLDAALAEMVAFLSALQGIEQVIETRKDFFFLTRDEALTSKRQPMVGHSDCRTFANRQRAVAKEIWLNQSPHGLSNRGDFPCARASGAFRSGPAGV